MTAPATRMGKTSRGDSRAAAAVFPCNRRRPACYEAASEASPRRVIETYACGPRAASRVGAARRSSSTAGWAGRRQFGVFMPEVFFNGPAGRLEGRFHPAKQRGAPIAVVLHPHPQFGGTMNNQI